ncbi:uncharacterized protein BDR25DRAFT_115814 [Lindgomyces ingoldianus]|uniref:Uncharacterized protein n=1 Tax=Lindgomyces ingoldianus TaxID=673940 RepID=A0ACB6Q8C8_9PLEO|nr:uncharacterized protein BDR25DRAFT_115814 [Lindgomyces ingoldianus]KAF2463174.1 hypothetical protein BDR25DRAFT_115814 [Lindgomyces ingoldianus]
MQQLGLILNDSLSAQDLPFINLPAPTPTAVSRPTNATVPLTAETAFLLQTYLRTVATWMDLFDHSLTYQLGVPRLTLSSPLLFHCTCAFTAKYLALSRASQKTSWTPVAQYHYGEALGLLIQLLNNPSQENVSTLLTAIILLSSYEVIGSLGQEHRKHFLASFSLIRGFGISASSTGIDRANFWIYVRHEISVALATEKPLILGPEEWNVHWEEGEAREDVLGNHILWIMARVINLVFREETETNTGMKEREDMLREVEQWREGLSDTFTGIPYGEADEEGFRKVYFTVSAAAAAAFWYHIIHILLYAEPILQDAAYKPEIQHHAMKVTNIAISEFPDSVRVFATHGLFYAAKHINGIARKARIWNVLHDVENELGYHTRSIINRLQELVERGS